MNIDELTRLLKLRGGFETVNANPSQGQVRLLGRVPKDHMGAWLLIVNELLVRGSGTSWSVDISKQYFRRDGKVMFAWRIILKAADAAQAVSAVCEAISSAPRPRVSVDEFPLPGVKGDRNVAGPNSRGKGAQGSLNSVVGPMALSQLGRSG